MEEDLRLDSDIVNRARERMSLADVAYRALKEAIESGRIPAGQWLRQEALARQLNMSQLTVREALGKLVADGLAVKEPYKGVRAVRASFDDLEELFNMRALLEGRAMELAAERITPAELAHMKEILPASIAQAGVTDANRIKANREFHWVAIRASGRAHLIRILAIVWDLSPNYHLILRPSLDTGQVRDTADYDPSDHLGLVQALEQGNGALARDVLVRHVSRTVELSREASRIADEQIAEVQPGGRGDD
jgi:DNA-binding GntR family transcriptional regulator